jgi:hypothetical protein
LAVREKKANSKDPYEGYVGERWFLLWLPKRTGDDADSRLPVVYDPVWTDRSTRFLSWGPRLGRMLDILASGSRIGEIERTLLPKSPPSVATEPAVTTTGKTTSTTTAPTKTSGISPAVVLAPPAKLVVTSAAAQLTVEEVAAKYSKIGELCAKYDYNKGVGFMSREDGASVRSILQNGRDEILRLFEEIERSLFIVPSDFRLTEKKKLQEYEKKLSERSQSRLAQNRSALQIILPSVLENVSAEIDLVSKVLGALSSKLDSDPEFKKEWDGQKPWPGSSFETIEDAKTAFSEIWEIADSRKNRSLSEFSGTTWRTLRDYSIFITDFAFFTGAKTMYADLNVSPFLEMKPIGKVDYFQEVRHFGIFLISVDSILKKLQEHAKGLTEHGVIIQREKSPSVTSTTTAPTKTPGVSPAVVLAPPAKLVVTPVPAEPVPSTTVSKIRCGVFWQDQKHPPKNWTYLQTAIPFLEMYYYDESKVSSYDVMFYVYGFSTRFMSAVDQPVLKKIADEASKFFRSFSRIF